MPAWEFCEPFSNVACVADENSNTIANPRVGPDMVVSDPRFETIRCVCATLGVRLVAEAIAYHGCMVQFFSQAVLKLC